MNEEQKELLSAARNIIWIMLNNENAMVSEVIKTEEFNALIAAVEKIEQVK